MPVSFLSICARTFVGSSMVGVVPSLAGFVTSRVAAGVMLWLGFLKAHSLSKSILRVSSLVSPYWELWWVLVES